LRSPAIKVSAYIDKGSKSHKGNKEREATRSHRFYFNFSPLSLLTKSSEG
jgi:hypothetical protein